MSAKQSIFLLDEPCKEAKEILRSVADFTDKIEESDMVWTGLTPITTDKVVACPCTGIYHVSAPRVIYLDYVWTQGEGKNITSTSEHTWSLLLQLAKLKRMQIKNKSLAIIGHGRIGEHIVTYAKAFGMRGKIFDKKNEHKPESYTLQEVLDGSDIITFHIPLQRNEGFIGEKEISFMKDGALIINTSRQGIFNITALETALNNGKLGGYADDFLNDYKICADNVIQTPHIGGSTCESRNATDKYIAYEVKKYIQNNPGGECCRCKFSKHKVYWTHEEKIQNVGDCKHCSMFLENCSDPWNY